LAPSWVRPQTVDGMPTVAVCSEADDLLEPLLTDVDLNAIPRVAVRKIEAVLDLLDPIGIAGYPNEYLSEARLLAALQQSNALTAQTLWAVFASQFGSAGILGAAGSDTLMDILGELARAT